VGVGRGDTRDVGVAVRVGVGVVVRVGVGVMPSAGAASEATLGHRKASDRKRMVATISHIKEKDLGLLDMGLAS
jgi:hypothetical protein